VVYIPVAQRDPSGAFAGGLLVPKVAAGGRAPRKLEYSRALLIEAARQVGVVGVVGVERFSQCLGL
jgi:hypothetical protein